VSEPEQRPRSRLEPLLERGLGVPGLFVAVYSAIGFSIYFSLGVVADRGLGLTPLIFLAAGLLFVLATLSYVEGGAMIRERGGSSSFARHAFNELIAFVAGWAILIDYLIVAALAAISVPHYLSPLNSGFSQPGWEIGVAVAVIAAACLLNVFNVTGRGRERWLALLALADIALQVAVIVVGLFAVFHPDRLTANLDLFSDPSLTDAIYAAVVAMLAYAGIEAASDMAPEINVRRRDLRRIVSVGAVAVPLAYAGMAAIALMAVPVAAGPDGPETALGSEFVEAPILGVVSAYQPTWVADGMRWIVALVAAPVLFWATTTSMLGVSRHIYTLAINRQIPSWLGKLNARHTTPHVAIAISGLIAIGLVLPADVKLLAGIYAFGATLAITIAHVSVLRLRVLEPDRPRPFKVPWNVEWRGARLPVPVLLAAALTGLAFLSVLAYHDTARWVGGGWMLFGLVFYVVYRKLVEGTSLTRRVSVTERALTKQVPELAYRSILVPVFGTKLDDDIVATAGRLVAAESKEAGDEMDGARLALVHVIEVPLALPLGAELPQREEEARRTLQRAKEVAEEYEDVAVSTETIRARDVGAGIVEAARRGESEAIVIGGEPPTKIRGGAMLGGVGAAKPAEIGAATEYVLKKAPCRVLLTAPPEPEPDPEPTVAD
jgi:basic amino acid/polyamine antiporter, APA family